MNGHQTLSIALYTDNVLEFWLDGQPYFGGDFYAFRKAPPVLKLNPGRHLIDLRLVRDVRAMGGADAKVSVTIKAEIIRHHLEVNNDQMLLPEVIKNCCLSSTAGSLPARNHAAERITILAIESEDVRVLRPSSRFVTYMKLAILWFQYASTESQYCAWPDKINFL